MSTRPFQFGQEEPAVASARPPSSRSKVPTQRIRPIKESENQTLAIRREQMQGHQAILKTALFGSGITGLVTIAAQTSHVSTSSITTWATVLTLTLLLRAMGGATYRGSARGEADESGESTSRWLRLFRILYLLHGVAWGLAAWLLLPTGEMSHQVVPIFAIVCVGVGALGVGAFDPVAAFTFTLLAFTPLAIRLLLEGGREYAYLSLLLVILLGYVRLIGRRAHGHVRENVALRVAEEARIEALLESERRLVDEIRARRASEQKADRALGVAEAASHVKSDFLARMSHELRTPLNGILGIAQLIEQTAVDPALRTQIRIVEESGQQLLSIINDVLDFSKISEGGLVLHSNRFRLHDTVGDLEMEYRQRAQKKGLRFCTDLGAEVPEDLRGDEPRVRQVLTNLLDNAVKFTSAGEVRLSVRASEADEEAARLRFEVTDTGIGVAPGERDRIFESFSQVENATVRRFGGTGLGLAICRGLVTAMDGRIGVIGHEGHGSTFWFELTLDRVTARTVPSEAQAPERRSRFTADVLLVDDNGVNCIVVKEMLSLLGCQVDIAADGQAAIDALSGRAYDLVLMDLHMPEMDGFAATRLVREQEVLTQRARTRIVALTADTHGADVDRCLAAGMDGHTAKPIDLKTLETVLHRFCPDRLS
jgi:signal transduction histidine kinase/ActR/RegA family two-component response regulator